MYNITHRRRRMMMYKSATSAICNISPVARRKIFRWKIPSLLRKFITGCKVNKFYSPAIKDIKLVLNEDRHNGEVSDDEFKLLSLMTSESILENELDALSDALQRDQQTSFIMFIHNMSDENESQIALHKREYVMRELIETERDFVRDLSLVVEGYMTVMKDPQAAGCDIPVSEDLRSGKDKIIFSNIELIYKWHRDVFLSAIEQGLTQPLALSKLSKIYERKFLMYVVYCLNKPISQYLVSEYDYYFEEMRRFLGHNLQLCDILIMPVVRIMRYQVLVQEMFHYTERARLVDEMEALQQAMRVMQAVPKAVNDMMDDSRLKGFNGKITNQGKLLQRGMLTCAKGTHSKPNREPHRVLHVFLFEQSIIFSEEVGKKTQFTSPVYVYKAHIQANKITLEDRRGSVSANSSDVSSDGSFTIRSTDSKRSPLWFVCRAHSDELRTEWLKNLRRIVQTHQDFVNALQAPIMYQAKLTKKASLL